MTQIKIKGAVVSNDDAEIYDWLGMTTLALTPLKMR